MILFLLQSSHARGLPLVSSGTASALSRSAAEWAFLQERTREAPADERRAWISRIELFTEQYPAAPETPRAVRLLADLYRAQGKAPNSLMELLRFLYSFPEDDGVAEAKATFLEWARESAGRAARPALDKLGAGADPSLSVQDRLAKPALLAARRFRARFPSFNKMADLIEAQARLYRAAGEQGLARQCYEELLGVYPKSRFGPKALLGIADIDVHGHGWWWRLFHRERWRERGLRAIGALNELLRKYPDDAADASAALKLEAWTFARCLRQYREAVEAERRLAKLSPGSPGALEALECAASMAHGKLKDYKLEISVRREIAAQFPQPSVAPKELLSAARLYSDELLDAKSAEAVLEEVRGKYPHSSASRRADKMLKELEKDKEVRSKK